MRDIWFRGKRKDNGEWVYGYYEKYNGGSYINLQTDRLNSGGYPIREFVEVIPETVGQYTGLTDKKGNKIFEGDIVKWNINFAIVWQDCKFVIKKDINAKPYDYVLSCFNGTELKVIGNIHDNPELLKGGAE